MNTSPFDTFFEIRFGNFNSTDNSLVQEQVMALQHAEQCAFWLKTG